MVYLISRGRWALVLVLAGCSSQEAGPLRVKEPGERPSGQGVAACGHASESESKAALDEAWSWLGKEQIESVLERITACASQTGCFRRAGAEARLSSALRLKSEVHLVRGQIGMALDARAEALRRDPGSWAASASWNSFEFLASILGASDEMVRVGEDLLRGGAVAPRLANTIRYSMARASAQLGDLEGAKRLHRELGCARAWSVVGPFNGMAGSGMARVFEPETGAAGDCHDDWGVVRAWRHFEDLPSPWIDLPTLYGRRREGIFYGATILHAPRGGPAQLHIGAGGSVKAWLNGQLILEAETPRALYDDLYTAAVELRPGVNRLMLKIGLDEHVALAGFAARLTGPDQQPLTDVTWLAARQPQAVEQTSTGASPNPTWWLYEELLHRYEDDPSIENALVLISEADNGDCEEDLLRRSPSFVGDVEHQCCTVLAELSRLASAARDAALLDRVNDVLESREALTIAGLNRRKEALNADDHHAEATELVRRFVRDVPGSFMGDMTLCEQLMAHGAEGEVREQIEYLERAHPKTPSASAAIGGLKRRQADRRGYLAYALELWNTNRRDPFATQMLLDAYGSTGDVGGIVELLGQLSSADPTDPNPSIALCQMQANSKMLDKAEQAAKEALARAPDDARSMEAWARVLHLQGNRDEARRWYRSALWAEPDDWSMRERYLQLTGDDGVLSGFLRESTETMVAADRRIPAFPEAHAYYVLADCQRCVLDDYASRVTFREIGRVNDATGVGMLSQQALDGVDNSLGFTVDRIFTLKPDGSRRKGEVKGSTASFTDLEPGDYFELVYAHHVTCLTPLGREVWQARILAAQLPVELSRFQLIHPRALSLTIRTPSKLPFACEESELGSSYLRKVWSARHLPELQFEVGATQSFLHDNLLDFSSVKDWRQVGEWYERQTYAPSKADRRVEAKAREIVGGLSSADERICALARYVSDQVGYSSPDFIVEAVRPTDAPRVLERGQGDCKDKCTLLLAMARSLGIKGSTALVNTEFGRCSPLLPSIRFDHLVAVLQGEERVFWIDPTGSYDPARTPRHLEGAHALLLDGEQSRIVQVPVEEASTSSTTMDTHLSIDREGRGSQQTTVRERGAMASLTFQALHATSKQRHAQLIGGHYAPEAGSFSVTKSTFPELGTLGEELEYSFEGERSIPLQRLGDRYLLTAPFQSRAESYTGLEHDRSYPFDTTDTKGLVEETVLLELPPQLVPVEIPGPTELSSPELDYRFRIEKQDDSRLVFHRSLAIKVLEVPPERCAEFRKMLSAVAEADRSIVSLAVRE